MLNQIPTASPVRRRVVQERSKYLKLVIPREDLHRILLAGAVVLEHHNLGVVLNDPSEAGLGEDLLPQMVSLEPVQIGRIAPDLSAKCDYCIGME